ncbi:hypothetical protein LVJ85_05455 [Neisseria sp. Dent CA1/247]|uniref:hypothetical protein n=1 Tax=Neisseria sp. Dent CA1/247 TaxID=2912675 RepID=UPI001FD3F73F|nr:hypothetical protein [Neisseria sp. Dent CA1/247]UOO77907.1 hypothetical protein LVJ85_05455 [Neisseria sp. Dent CA1/247]
MWPSKTNQNEMAINVSELSTAELKERLAAAVSITAEYLTYIAAVWQELEKRGEDMSSLRHGLMAYIPMIANKRLDARVVVNYAGQKTLIASLASLPIERQQQLIEKGSIDIVELSDDKQQLVRSVELSQLTAAQVYQAIGDGYIKKPDEQYQMLLVRDSHKAKAKPKRTYRMTSNVKIEGGNLVVAGKHGISIDHIIELLKGSGKI